MATVKLPDHFVPRRPEGDERERLVCERCDFVHYENPRIIVGSVCTWGDLYLLCKRAIEPCVGRWTLPAGFLEVEETAAEGAAREAWEEARARIRIDGLLAIYDVVHTAQVQLMFRAKLVSPEVTAGPESSDVALLGWQEIPWDELAFPTVGWALRAHRQAADGPLGAPFTNPAGDPRGRGGE